MADSSSFFLDVSSSVTGRAWRDRLGPDAQRLAQAMSQRDDMPEITARILAGRGIGPEDADLFLAPTLRALMPDPSTMTGMDALAERLADAILRRERIALLGDYDVDGACCCALMSRYLGAFGLVPDVHIPDRLFEGYGPNRAAMDRLIGQGASLIVTLDCGTASVEPIAHARDRGADVLVVDHHIADHALPPANALVNPNRPDDVSGLGHLCAAGVAFMALVATSRVLRGRGQPVPDLMGLVDLVALATVCDVVPLEGLNRAFVARGLEIMRQGRNRGIAALALAARLAGPINAYHLGFLIGPRINAGGRIGDAALGARLLASDDEAAVQAIAAELDALNTERQRIEREALDEAVAAAEAEIGTGSGPPVLVLASGSWHPGVVGLVAARLRERFDRPAFAIALGADGMGTGSGRSVAGADIGRAVVAAVEAGIAAKGGGHAMAAGVTLKESGIARFRAHLTEMLGAAVAANAGAASLMIDAAVTARGAGPALVHEIDRAGPFGVGNPAPVFAFPAHRARFAEIVGSGGHVRFTLTAADGARLKAVAFRAADTVLGREILASGGERPLHVAGCLTLDHWQGREQTQVRVIDVAVPG